jgi:hypothetical protein
LNISGKQFVRFLIEIPVRLKLCLAKRLEPHKPYDEKMPSDLGDREEMSEVGVA